MYTDLESWIAKSRLLGDIIETKITRSGFAISKYISKSKKIIIPEGVKSITYGAFDDNPLLEEVHLPTTLVFLGDIEAPSLKRINIPAKIETIPSFDCMQNLTLVLEGENKELRNGGLYGIIHLDIINSHIITDYRYDGMNSCTLDKIVIKSLRKESRISSCTINELHVLESVLRANTLTLEDCDIKNLYCYRDDDKTCFGLIYESRKGMWHHSRLNNVEYRSIEDFRRIIDEETERSKG